MSNWTHPICLRCWYALHPARKPVRISGLQLENCCRCGTLTAHGIYFRADPAELHCGGVHDDQAPAAANRLLARLHLWLTGLVS